MVRIYLKETIKYKRTLYYANSEIEVEDEDVEEISKFGEVLDNTLLGPIDEDFEYDKETEVEDEDVEEIDLKEMTSNQLTEYAKELGLDVSKCRNKAQKIEIIKQIVQ